MLEGQYRWDVFLRTDEDDQPIRAHQLVLVAGSPFFENTLNAKFTDKEEPVFIKDVSHSVLKEVVRQVTSI